MIKIIPVKENTMTMYPKNVSEPKPIENFLTTMDVPNIELYVAIGLGIIIFSITAYIFAKDIFRIGRKK